MKAARLTEYLENPKHLVISDNVNEPKSDNLVVIKNEYAGINFLDIYQRKGQYAVQLPHILGNEGGGRVHRLPSNYQGDLKVGDQVVYLGSGSYAENTAVDPIHVFKVPEGCSLERATAYILQGMTAVYLTKDTFPVTKGSKVLVLAAAGGTGSVLCHQCKHLGATVIGTVSTEEKAKEAKAYCDYVINYATEDLCTAVKRIFPEGVDVVYDSVGRATLSSSAECLKQGGTLVSYGWSSGLAETPNRRDIIFKQDALFNYIKTKEEFYYLAKKTFENVHSQKIYKVYDLAQVGQAHADLESRKTSGKLLLKI